MQRKHIAAILIHPPKANQPIAFVTRLFMFARTYLPKEHQRWCVKNGYMVLGSDRFLYLSARNMLIFNVRLTDKYKNLSLRCAKIHRWAYSHSIVDGGLDEMS